jgi:S-adenosylmethionine hydrolase
MRPVIALLTDFGTRDHYVGTMKGVVLSICPDATFVDITHDVPPQDILGGALELGASYAYFPGGTIFVVVVDPGVGSARRGIAVHADKYLFVAPDNGVLTTVLDALDVRAVELTESRYARPVISRTFEGRDRFAPAAAWLATGVPLSELGPPAGTLVRLSVPRAEAVDDGISGEVLSIDRFGNLITNIDRPLFERCFANRSVDVRVGPHVVATLVSTYADAAPGVICALFGSSDRLEVAMNGGSAADALRVARGAPVHLARGA